MIMKYDSLFILFADSASAREDNCHYSAIVRRRAANEGAKSNYGAPPPLERRARRALASRDYM